MDNFTIRLPDAELVGQATSDDARTVFVHGDGGDWLTWDRIWEHWDGPSALRYDLRGFGQSRALNEAKFSHADDLLGLLDARGIERANLIGLSMGGGVVLNFALDHPNRVNKLVLICPMIMGWDWSKEWRALYRPIIKAAKSGDMATAKRLWWEHPLFDAVRDTEAGADLMASIERTSGNHWLADNQRDAMPDVERLHNLALPTLLLTGDHDMAEFRLMADLISASAECVERADICNSGHMLPLEQPEICSGQIANFLINIDVD